MSTKGKSVETNLKRVQQLLGAGGAGELRKGLLRVWDFFWP
jgi:hypothetical protein